MPQMPWEDKEINTKSLEQLGRLIVFSPELLCQCEKALDLNWIPDCRCSERHHETNTTCYPCGFRTAVINAGGDLT